MKNYNDLNTVNKIRAILGAVREPVSKNDAIGFSEVSLAFLSNQDAKDLESLFQECETNTSGIKRYYLPGHERELLSETVDMKSVHGQIAGYLARQIGF